MTDISELIKAVKVAATRLDDCRKEESYARSGATSALNALNSAQNAVDKAIDELKSDAERDSNWNRQQRTAR